MLSEVFQLTIKVYVGILFPQSKLHLLNLRESLNFAYAYRRSSSKYKRFLKTAINL